MQRSRNDVWVGLLVLLGGLALLFLALKSANLLSLSFQSTYALSARFDNIGGLKPQAAVKSAGVVVGRVSDVRFDNESYEAIVTFNVDAQYQFPRDTSAKILTSGLLGEQYIGLMPGGDSEMLQGGNEFKKTQSAIVLEEMIGKFLFNKAESAK